MSLTSLLPTLSVAFHPQFLNILYHRILTADTGLTNLGEVWTQFTRWIENIVSTITSSPILLIGLGIFVVGATIGLAQRLIRG